MDRADVAALFDRMADDYDSVGVDFFQPIAQGLVDAVDPQPGERVLDVGCGRGAALLRLAERVAPGGTAVGVDLSPRMVDHARETAAQAAVEVEVRVGDAMDPDVVGPFDVVVSSAVLFFLPDPAGALRRWRSLLAPGGRIGVSTFGPYDERWRRTVDAALAAHAPADGRDARTTGAAGPFASDQGMEQLLGEAGFVDLRTEGTVVRPRFDDPAHWHRWSMSVGQRRFWEAVPAERFDEVRAAVYAAVDACRDDEGRIGFDQQVRYTLGRVAP